MIIYSKTTANAKVTVSYQAIMVALGKVRNHRSVIRLSQIKNNGSNEEDEPGVVKVAYTQPTCPDNDYQVNDVLTYTDSVEALNRFS